MKQECEIVRDLMPLVLDDVASDGSKHMVSAHVQTCAQCAAYMNQLKADLPAGRKSELDSRAAFDAVYSSRNPKIELHCRNAPWYSALSRLSSRTRSF